MSSVCHLVTAGTATCRPPSTRRICWFEAWRIWRGYGNIYVWECLRNLQGSSPKHTSSPTASSNKRRFTLRIKHKLNGGWCAAQSTEEHTHLYRGETEQSLPRWGVYVAWYATGHSVPHVCSPTSSRQGDSKHSRFQCWRRDCNDLKMLQAVTATEAR